MLSQIAAIAATKKLSNFPMTAADSPNNSTKGPTSAPIGSPITGIRKNMPSEDSTVASIQTMLESMPVEMPSSFARSEFSDAARTPIPIRVNLKNAQSPTTTIATAKTITIEFASNVSGVMWNFSPENGVLGGTGSSSRLAPSQLGRKNWMTANTSETPMVATVSTSRGALENRRMTTSSTV